MNILKSAANFLKSTGDEALGAVKRVGMPRDEAGALNRMQNEARDIMGEKLGMSSEDIGRTNFEDMLTKASNNANVSAFGKEVQRVSSEGGTLSKEGMEGMMRNQMEVGNMYAGFSRAGATASPSGLLRGIGGEGNRMENIGGIAAMAAMAGGANVMMGGDFSTGSAVGLAGGLGVRGVAKSFASSMGEIEGIAMKRMLGDDMVGAGTKVKAKAGTKLGDLNDSQMSNVTMGEVSPLFNNKNQSVLDYLTDPNMPAGAGNTRQGLELSSDITYEVTAGQARKQNLQAVQDLTDDELKAIGPGAKRMQSMMDPNKSKNTALNNRALTLGGAMLSGVAFTGQSDKRNYRRGFNAHRGNRI